MADNYGFRSVSTSRFYHFDSFSGGNFLGRGTGDYTSLYDASTLSMVWKAGNVGIGTTSPKLNFNGGTFLTVLGTGNSGGWLVTWNFV